MDYSIFSHSLWPHGLHSPRISLGQNTGVGSHSLLQRIFPTQGSNLGSPALQANSLPAEPTRKAQIFSKMDEILETDQIEFIDYFFEGMNTFEIFSLPIQERDSSLQVSDYLLCLWVKLLVFSVWALLIFNRFNHWLYTDFYLFFHCIFHYIL